MTWTSVEEAEDLKKIEAGGYVCGITAVEDNEQKEYLRLEFDIIEGEFKGYYRDLYDRRGFWGGSFIRSYKESARGFFKKFLNAVEASNPNYSFDNNEKKLRGKTVGLVLGYEEYISNSGEVKERIYVADIVSLDDIRAGNYTAPRFKALAPANEHTSDSLEELAYSLYGNRKTEPFVNEVIAKLKQDRSVGFKKDIERLKKAFSVYDDAFLRELKRARSKPHKYLLVEQPDGWERILSHSYPNNYSETAFWSMLHKIEIEYDLKIKFLSRQNMGREIYTICRFVLDKYIQR